MSSITQKTKNILLVDRCSCLIQNSDLDLSEQQVKDLIHKNRSAFRRCHTTTDIAPLLQNIIISEKMEVLLKEAGLNWPVRYAQNLATNWEDVFRECKTQEDAIQRLKDLDKLIPKS